MGQQGKVVIFVPANVYRLGCDVQILSESWSSASDVGEIVHLQPALSSVSAKLDRVDEVPVIYWSPGEDSSWTYFYGKKLQIRKLISFKKLKEIHLWSTKFQRSNLVFNGHVQY